MGQIEQKVNVMKCQSEYHHFLLLLSTSAHCSLLIDSLKGSTKLLNASLKRSTKVNRYNYLTFQMLLDVFGFLQWQSLWHYHTNAVSNAPAERFYNNHIL
jgi:hypothetical protein